MTTQYLLVLFPAVTAIVIGGWFIRLQTRRRGVAPVDDLGVWYLGIVVVYTVLPLISFAALGLQYTPLNDARLFVMQPSVGEVSGLGWLYCLYGASFALAYGLASRQPVAKWSPDGAPISRSLAIAIVILLSSSQFLLFVIRTMFGVHSSGYADSYLTVQALPLGVRQIWNLCSGTVFIFSLAALYWLFGNYARTRWIIAGWLAYELISTIALGGARSEAVLLFGAAAVMYHARVHPIRLRVAVTTAVGATVVFLAMGALRAIGNLQGLGQATPTGSVGEFEVLFANALDVERRKSANEVSAPSFSFYMSDLVAAVPSQVLPFQKIDPADWYVSTFYPVVKAQGGGLAFGVITQGVLGFGPIELLLRGLVTGIIFARIAAAYRRHSRRFWVTVGYIWLLLLTAVSFRTTSFYFLQLFAHELLPAAVVAELLRALLGGALRVDARAYRPAMGVSEPLAVH